MRRRWWLLIGLVVIVFAVIVVVFVRDAQTSATPVALPLTQSFNDSASITFKYPDDWSYAIPAQGLIIVGPNQTINGGEPGPTLTIQRAEPLSIVGTLDAALDRYLQNGPLHAPDRWQVTTAAHPIQFGGQDARAVELEGSDSASAPPDHTQIITTTSKNQFVYLLITTVPVSKQAAYDPTLAAMLDAVKILE
ncbi:MAG TPA: hypothetical protein VHD90_11865 [Phototrophicaceae bacterium]|nr:hypothetical protein [Phototrophicaceae bacterium]